MMALSKGLGGSLQRLAVLPFRYGIGPDRLRTRLNRMNAYLARWDVVPTIPVTGVLLRRYPFLAGTLRNIDVAIHGFCHVPYDAMSAIEQVNDLDLALESFEQYGLYVRGFRSPYLRAARGTMLLLRQRSFLFDSSVPYVALPEAHPAYARVVRLATERYGPIRRIECLASSDTIPIELPVALPDDEILSDGMEVRSPSAIWGVYEAMLERVSKQSGLLVLQIHPERFEQFEDALGMLLSRVSDDGAWKASLTDVAEWIVRGHGRSNSWPDGRPYALSITGDLDAMALGDFASRFLGA